MSGNRVLRRIFAPKRDEVTGEWRKLHNEEPNDLYYSTNIIRVIEWRRMRWVRHEACVGARRGVYKFLVGTPEEKRQLGRPRHKRKNNIKMDLREMGCGAGNGVIWLRIGTGSGVL